MNNAELLRRLVNIQRDVQALKYEVVVDMMPDWQDAEIDRHAATTAYRQHYMTSLSAAKTAVDNYLDSL